MHVTRCQPPLLHICIPPQFEATFSKTSTHQRRRCHKCMLSNDKWNPLCSMINGLNKQKIASNEKELGANEKKYKKASYHKKFNTK